MMGEELKDKGIARMVGADIIPEARDAAHRDRPEVDDDYYVADFSNAMKLIRTDGWLAFNIKDSFLDHSDQTGFSRLIRELIFSEYLEIYHLALYRHRLSMEGTRLFYYALVGRLTASIPEDFLEQHKLETTEEP